MTAKNKESLHHFDRLPEDVLADANHIPVAALREVIRGEIREHSNFVLVGETGSGKTTCLPPLLLELRNELKLKGSIAVTQPRRVATRSVTARVSDMMGCTVGERVGYHIRFEDITQDSTDITFMTDGILLRKIQFDPLLLEYSIVMVDEAHERTLNIDLCLGLLKDVNERRQQSNIEPLRIVVSSATIERNKFAEYIGTKDSKNSLEISGKMFPVEVFYESETPWGYDFTEGAANKVKKIVKNNIEGDILIFMPGKKEISDTIEKIKAAIGENTAEIIPLHAELSPEDQDKVFLPSEKRKIIVSTNVAETSVTIDGIIHVIDSGVIKQTQFNPATGIEQLVLAEHALSGLDQRKGRAGRTAPGFCYRLFTEDSLRSRPLYQTPEIQRSNLIQLVLVLKKMGITDVTRLKFLDQPHANSLVQAEEMLDLLGGLDKYGELNEIGELLFELALEPRLGRMIIEAIKPDINCINEICIIAAFLDGKNVFVRPSDLDLQKEADNFHEQFKKDKDSDFVVILNVWKAYVNSGYNPEWAKKNYLNEKVLEEAKNVRLDLLDVLKGQGITIEENAKIILNKDAIGKAITAGLIGNLMRYSRASSLKKIDGTKSDISVHPGSVFFRKSLSDGSLLVSDEIFINPQGKVYACNCLEIKREWLKEIAPGIAKAIAPPNHHKKGKSHEHQGRHSPRTVYSRHSHNRR